MFMGPEMGDLGNRGGGLILISGGKVILWGCKSTSGSISNFRREGKWRRIGFQAFCGRRKMELWSEAGRLFSAALSAASSSSSSSLFVGECHKEMRTMIGP